MREFVECTECGFVTYAAGGTAPEPKDWDACPDCGSNGFEFADRES